MRINFDNYEAYYLDYLEGRLDVSMIKELNNFLELHPTLHIAFNKTDLLYINPNDITYTEKQSLKKFEFDSVEITETNINDFCIAHYESLLDVAKTNELLEFLNKHTNQIETFNLYQKSYLKPQNEIRCKFKKELYRKASKTVSFVPYIRWASLAACISLLFVGFWQYIKYPQEEKITSSDKSINLKQTITKATITGIPTKTVSRNEKTKIVKPKHTFSKVFLPIDSTKRPDKQEESLPYIANAKVYNQNLNNDSLKDIIIEKLTSYTKTNTLLADNQIQQETIPNNESDNKSPLLWIANATVTQFNHLTGSNIKITDKKKNHPNHVTFSFKTGILEYYHSKSE